MNSPAHTSMGTESASSGSPRAELHHEAGRARADALHWSLPSPEVEVFGGIYGIAVWETAERWMSAPYLGIVAIWLFVRCWSALTARHATATGMSLDTRTARGRYAVEGVALRTLVPTVALSTVLLAPFALMAAATASLRWWERALAYAGVALLIRLLRGLWQAWRSRPSA